MGWSAIDIREITAAATANPNLFTKYSSMI
jgi:hypothetical protein